MTGRGITVEFGRGYGADFQPLARQTVATLTPDEVVPLSAPVPLEPGVRSYGVRLLPLEGAALLNDTLSTVAARDLPAQGPVVAQPLTDAPGPGLPLFTPAPAGLPVASARLLDPSGNAVGQSRATVLPGLPGDAEAVITWVPASLPGNEPAAFQLSATPVAQPSPITWQKTGNLLTVTAPGYQAVLDLAAAQVTSLRTSATGPGLIASPWAFTCTAYSGSGPVEVTETPAGLCVTVPFSNPQAEGFSRYFLYADAPVVRIERYFAPRQDLIVTASSEGCGMAQRGGTFARQPGVGAPVERGQLHDSSEYRDLLFGYLGASPAPEHARLAGWFDCAFTQDGGGGLGVVIERRWEAAFSDVGYDVTRYYDGADGISVLNLWGQGLTVTAPQTQVVYLLPHGPLDLDQPRVTGPAQRLWTSLHHPAVPVVSAAR
jgi:hypothetical protein